MKFLVASDIHGSKSSAEHILRLVQEHQAEKILLLGDVLYHGPRNPLPEDYAPKEVVGLLNSIAAKIIAVRGNCDSEVDQMVLEFSLHRDDLMIVNEGCTIIASHGHIYSPENLPQMNEGDAFIYGHVHLPVAKKQEGKYILNPGSITLPKENNPRSYAVLDEKSFTIYDLEDQILKHIEFGK